MFFCHQCQQFYPPHTFGQNPTQCFTCFSPLIEAVDNSQQRAELEALIQQSQQQQSQQQQSQQQSQHWSGPRHRINILNAPTNATSLLSSLAPFLNQVMIEVIIADDGDGEVSTNSNNSNMPTIEELMHSFITFPDGLSERERAAHPEVVADVNCRICLESLTETPVVMLPCHHCYHSHCIKPWLQRRRRCPLCRASVISGNNNNNNNTTNNDNNNDDTTSGSENDSRSNSNNRTRSSSNDNPTGGVHSTE